MAKLKSFHELDVKIKEILNFLQKTELSYKPDMALADCVLGNKIELTSSACHMSSEKITLQMVTSGLVAGIASPVTAISMRPSADDLNSLDKFVAVGKLFFFLFKKTKP